VFDALLPWYALHRRDLPMRAEGVSPWGTLVFEVMSQQTPIPRVQPIWERWMRDWPEPSDLAAAPTADVLVAWDRLGYPSRALRLQQCAAAVAARPGGRVPADMDELMALPGIGPYTASAVSCFAYHRRVAVLDTNVRRVLARTLDGREFAPSSSPGRRERSRAESLLPDDGEACADWNVALMELGALVCDQRAPRCEACPLASECAWLTAGRPAAEVRPRGQAWAGTDRQARGRVMASLRAAHVEGRPLTRADALSAATLPGADPAQASRAVDGLVADGLAVADPVTRDLGLPG
jgi:A/G-specific adenine glycosylase